jgi:hypothetical protein
MLLVVLIVAASGQWPSCLPPLCQDTYASSCSDLVCCNGGESCARHASSGCTAETSSFLCVKPGFGTTIYTTPTLQPYHSDEIFQVCGRYAEATEDQTYTGVIPDAPFRVCNVFTENGYSNC